MYLQQIPLIMEKLLIYLNALRNFCMRLKERTVKYLILRDICEISSFLWLCYIYLFIINNWVAKTEKNLYSVSHIYFFKFDLKENIETISK